MSVGLRLGLSTDSLFGVTTEPILLLEYLKSLKPEVRQAFAERCKTSVDYLFLIAYGKRQPKIGLAVSIERESEARVRCETLLPAVDWAYIRSTGQEAPA